MLFSYDRSYYCASLRYLSPLLHPWQCLSFVSTFDASSPDVKCCSVTLRSHRLFLRIGHDLPHRACPD